MFNDIYVFLIDVNMFTYIMLIEISYYIVDCNSLNNACFVFPTIYIFNALYCIVLYDLLDKHAYILFCSRVHII